MKRNYAKEYACMRVQELCGKAQLAKQQTVRDANYASLHETTPNLTYLLEIWSQ